MVSSPKYDAVDDSGPYSSERLVGGWQALDYETSNREAVAEAFSAAIVKYHGYAYDRGDTAFGIGSVKWRALCIDPCSKPYGD